MTKPKKPRTPRIVEAGGELFALVSSRRARRAFPPKPDESSNAPYRTQITGEGQETEPGPKPDPRPSVAAVLLEKLATPEAEAFFRAYAADTKARPKDRKRAEAALASLERITEARKKGLLP